MDDTFDLDMEKQIIDVDEIEGKDLNLNSQAYIHYGIIKAQDCLKNPNIEQGMLQYIMIVEHIESIAKADKRLPDDYDKIMYDFGELIKKEDIKGDRKLVRIANKKLEIIMGHIFSHATLKQSLKG